MKLVALSLLVLLAVPAVAPVASARHMCNDAPFLPGAISQFYDMWNNIYRYYTCSHVDEIIGGEFVALKVVLP